MPGIAKIIRAIENCVDVPKCRNCPWETCEEIDHKSVEVPLDLMISVLSVIREQNKKISALKKELKISGSGGSLLKYTFNRLCKQTDTEDEYGAKDDSDADLHSYRSGIISLRILYRDGMMLYSAVNKKHPECDHNH